MDRLLLKTTHSPPRVFELSPGLNRLGRNPTNDFRIQDASVSSFHCEIVVGENSVLIRDLGSTNGTFVDGHPIEEAEIKVGQTLQVGSVKLELEPFSAEGPIVRIPEFTTREAAPPAAVTMPDGSPGCPHHTPPVKAVFKCTHCHQAFCAGCVRSLALSGSQEMQFCPACSAVCERLPGVHVEPTPVPPAPPQKSFLGRLTQTLKLPFKR